MRGFARSRRFDIQQAQMGSAIVDQSMWRFGWHLHQHIGRKWNSVPACFQNARALQHVQMDIGVRHMPLLFLSRFEYKMFELRGFTHVQGAYTYEMGIGDFFGFEYLYNLHQKLLCELFFVPLLEN
jgi:hypothetical protein